MDAYTQRKLLGTNRRIDDAALDQYTGGVPVISCLLNQVYRGNVWAFAHRKLDVGLNQSIVVQINTGALPVYLHRAKLWTDTALAEADFIRAPDEITPGNALDIYRLNHLIPIQKPDGLAVYGDSTGITGGTVCPCSFLGGGNALAIGSRADADLREMPLIMSPNTTYVIRLKNLENADRHFSVQGFVCVEQD
jgi:hypothetical protein